MRPRWSSAVSVRGIDIIGTLTNKTMQSLAAGFTVVGQADCIGGIRYADRSFFVATDIRSIENPQSDATGTLNPARIQPERRRRGRSHLA